MGQPQKTEYEMDMRSGDGGIWEYGLGKGKAGALQMLCRILSFEQDMRLGDLVGEKKFGILFSQ